MKEFKDLEIRGPRDALDRFVPELSRKLPTDWRRAPDLETTVGRATGAPAYAFAVPRTASEPAADLWLNLSSEAVLYVSNVVPREHGSLDYDEYNRILDIFARAAKPVAEALGLTICETSGTWEIEDLVSEDTAKRLRSFSAAANRSTGAAHPLDQRRWFEFVLGCHRENSRLQSTELQRWLTESASWPAAAAEELAIEYEQQRALLNFSGER